MKIIHFEAEKDGKKVSGDFVCTEEECTHDPCAGLKTQFPSGAISIVSDEVFETRMKKMEEADKAHKRKVSAAYTVIRDTKKPIEERFSALLTVLGMEELS